MKKKEYFHPDYTNPIDQESLKTFDEDDQIKIMQEWFYSNFEDPAEHTPYETREGGYNYIWGGPYDAKEELENEFEGIVPESAIAILANKLERESTEWSGTISASSYNEYFYSVIFDNHEFTETLKDNLNSVKKILQIPVSIDIEQHLYKMLFVNIITILETFLADAFIGTVIKDENLIKQFVKSNVDFANRKYTLNNIFDRIEKIEDEVKSYLLDIIWHNLAKVKLMFESTLNIVFPEDMAFIYKAIIKRHDIVHRNGKNKTGLVVEVNRDELIELMDEVNGFAEYIDSNFNQ